MMAHESGRWEELNPELLAMIFVRIPIDEMVRHVPLVCKSWMAAVAEPYCWHDIDVVDWCQRHYDINAIDQAVMKLVRLSKRTFQRLSVYRLGNTGFGFIANRARCLKTLEIPMSEVTDDMVLKHVKSLRNLTVLDISDCSKITVIGLEAFGNQCKSLVSLKRNMFVQRNWDSFEEPFAMVDDSEANIIANSMPNLQNLELGYGLLGDYGLFEILTKCKSLTRLDIQGSSNAMLNGGFEESLQRLEYFRSPHINYSDEFYKSGADSL